MINRIAIVNIPRQPGDVGVGFTAARGTVLGRSARETVETDTGLGSSPDTWS